MLQIQINQFCGVLYNWAFCLFVASVVGVVGEGALYCTVASISFDQESFVHWKFLALHF